MDLDCRLHARINYLNLEHELPLLLGLNSNLESYNESLQVIERAMQIPSSDRIIKPTINELSHWAAFLYDCHLSSCRRQIDKFPTLLRPQDDSSTKTPDTPAEKHALLDELNRATEKTQILGYELPEHMPSFATWKYLHEWKWALPQSSLEDCGEDNWSEASVDDFPEDADWINVPQSSQSSSYQHSEPIIG